MYRRGYRLATAPRLHTQGTLTADHRGRGGQKSQAWCGIYIALQDKSRVQSQPCGIILLMQHGAMDTHSLAGPT